MVTNEEINTDVALSIDSLIFVTYFFFWATLTGAAIYFKVLERRYSMKIKKLQLFAAIMLGFTSIITGICYQTTSAIVLRLIKKEPLSSFPEDTITMINILTSISLSFSLLNDFLIVYLLLNIGRVFNNEGGS